MRQWTRADAARFVRAPGPADHKRTRGVVALRTGSNAYPGAAVLGVEAAWRSGAGFVRFVGTGRVCDAVLARRPETVVGEVAGADQADAWVIGSGADPAERTPAEELALRGILGGPAPVVVDAGALDLAPGATAELIVTPHEGEFVRLRRRLGIAGGADRASQAAQTARVLGRTVLRKGSQTLIASPAGEVIAIGGAPAWLATAGTGDVLAAVIGTMIAQNPQKPLAESAAAAVWLHSRAAAIAAGTLTGGIGHPIVASDVASALPFAVADLLA